MSFSIKDRLKEINNKISAAAVASQRNSEDVRLLAVSKTYPVETIKDAYDAGQRMFGENKVQELELKAPVLPDDIEWHLIGHLQSNKTSKAVEYAKYIHSVDSLKLINRIDRIAGEKNRKPKILIEVNVSGEESKFGITQEEVERLTEAAVNCEHLELVGLMTMAPFDAGEEELKKVFSRLRELKKNLEKKYNIVLPELSMGMSSDFEIAIEEGATIVRIGTAIFGQRNYV